MAEAYLIANTDIHDPERYDEYRRLVPPTFAKFDGSFLVRGGHFELVEGEAIYPRLVIGRFPSFEAARSWYYSPEYATARDIRQAASRGNLVIFEGRSEDAGANLGPAPGFVLTMGTVHDPEGMKAYFPPTRQTVGDHKGQVLHGGQRRERLEGEEPPPAIVLLAFPGFQAAKDWYHSPEYAEATATGWEIARDGMEIEL